MKIDPVDHPGTISESSLESDAGQSEATTAEQVQWQATLTRSAFEKELAQGRENADPNTQARVAFGMQNGEKRVQPNEIDRWLRLGKVKPREAALILCLHDPIHDCGKTPALFVTEIKARDFEWLLKAFEDMAETKERSSCVRARTLLDWRDLARDRNLKYHPYFDQFEQVPDLIAEIETKANPEVPEDVAPPHRPARRAVDTFAAKDEAPHEGNMEGVRIKLFYSIRELARIIGENTYKTANALETLGVTMTHDGKPANLSGWTGGIIRRGNDITVKYGYYDDPDPSEVLVLTDLLPTSWVKKIQAQEAETGAPASNESAVGEVEVEVEREATDSAEPTVPVNENTVTRRKRKALVKELVSIWPSIERDLSDASRSGLSLTAKLGGTLWDLTKAVCWAVERGKITKAKAEQSLATDPDSVFAMTLRQLFKI